MDGVFTQPGSPVSLKAACRRLLVHPTKQSVKERLTNPDVIGWIAESPGRAEQKQSGPGAAYRICPDCASHNAASSQLRKAGLPQAATPNVAPLMSFMCGRHLRSDIKLICEFNCIVDLDAPGTSPPRGRVGTDLAGKVRRAAVHPELGTSRFRVKVAGQNRRRFQTKCE